MYTMTYIGYFSILKVFVMYVFKISVFFHIYLHVIYYHVASLCNIYIHAGFLGLSDTHSFFFSKFFVEKQ